MSDKDNFDMHSADIFNDGMEEAEEKAKEEFEEKIGMSNQEMRPSKVEELIDKFRNVVNSSSIPREKRDCYGAWRQFNKEYDALMNSIASGAVAEQELRSRLEKMDEHLVTVERYSTTEHALLTLRECKKTRFEIRQKLQMTSSPETAFILDTDFSHVGTA